MLCELGREYRIHFLNRAARRVSSHTIRGAGIGSDQSAGPFSVLRTVHSLCMIENASCSTHPPPDTPAVSGGDCPMAARGLNASVAHNLARGKTQSVQPANRRCCRALSDRPHLGARGVDAFLCLDLRDHSAEMALVEALAVGAILRDLVAREWAIE